MMRRASLGSLAIGVAVGLTLTTVVSVAGGVELAAHTQCSLSGPVGQGIFWTPWALVNAPYNGSVTWTAQFELFEKGMGLVLVNLSGPPHTSNESVATGYFETENWTVYFQTNVTRWGPGTNAPCGKRFVAEPSAPAYDVGVDGPVLQGPGNTSNVNEPTTFNYRNGPYPSAVFANEFEAPNLPNITTCDGPSKTVNFSSAGFQVGLILASTHGPVSMTLTIVSAEHFVYLFPADGGTWEVDDLLDNPGLTGPGLAFAWSPCS